MDDAICLMIYSVASSVAKVFIKHEQLTIFKVLVHPISKEFTNKPDTGVMFVMPILECYGIKNVEYEKH